MSGYVPYPLSFHAGYRDYFTPVAIGAIEAISIHR